jgi:hypothetical protein
MGNRLNSQQIESKGYIPLSGQNYKNLGGSREENPTKNTLQRIADLLGNDRRTVGRWFKDKNMNMRDAHMRNPHKDLHAQRKTTLAEDVV